MKDHRRFSMSEKEIHLCTASSGSEMRRIEGWSCSLLLLPLLLRRPKVDPKDDGCFYEFCHLRAGRGSGKRGLSTICVKSSELLQVVVAGVW